MSGPVVGHAADIDRNYLHSTTDAREWAKAWLDTAARIMLERGPVALFDEGWRIAWFANALETGRVHGRRELCPHESLFTHDENPEDVFIMCRECGQVLDGGTPG